MMGTVPRSPRSRRFWQFHKFIDGKFQAWLQAQSATYDALDHTAV